MARTLSRAGYFTTLASTISGYVTCRAPKSTPIAREGLAIIPAYPQKNYSPKQKDGK
jgi:hypothetical protein